MAESRTATATSPAPNKERTLDHFWRLSIQSKLLKNPPCKHDIHDYDTCSEICAVHRVLYEVLAEVPVRLTLQRGVLVEVISDEGVYCDGRILQQQDSNGLETPYEDPTVRPDVVVPMWVCSTETELGNMQTVIVHRSQLRPRIGTCVTPALVHDKSGVSVNDQQFVICSGLRRGDKFETPDGVSHFVIVNDVKLLLVIDDECGIFNYLQIKAVEVRIGKPVPPPFNLVKFGRLITSTAQSLVAFDASNENIVAEQAEIDVDQSRRTHAHNLETTESRSHSIRSKVIAVATRCRDVCTETDEIERHTRREQDELKQWLHGTATATATAVNGVSQLVADLKEERVTRLEDMRKICNGTAAAMSNISGICDDAKDRHKILLDQRRLFHEEILSSVDAIKTEFDRIGCQMERHFVADGEEEVYQRLLDLLREVNVLASQRCNSGVDAFSTIMQIRQLLATVYFRGEAGPTEDHVELDQTAHVQPTPLSVDAEPLECAPEPPPLHPTQPEESMSSEQPQTNRTHRKGKENGETTTGKGLRTGIKTKSNTVFEMSVNKYTHTIGVKTEAFPTSSVMQKTNTDAAATLSMGISEAPPYVMHPIQPAVQLRRWGRKLPLEVKFLRDYIVIPGSVRTNAAKVVGGALPPDSKYYQQLPHVRNFCSFVCSAIVGSESRSVDLFLPKPDDSDASTTTALISKQSYGLQSAMKCYIETFKPTDTENVRLCMQNFVWIRKEEFERGVNQLQGVVSDPSLLDHLC